MKKRAKLINFMCIVEFNVSDPVIVMPVGMRAEPGKCSEKEAIEKAVKQVNENTDYPEVTAEDCSNITIYDETVINACLHEARFGKFDEGMTQEQAAEKYQSLLPLEEATCPCCRKAEVRYWQDEWSDFWFMVSEDFHLELQESKDWDSGDNHGYRCTNSDCGAEWDELSEYLDDVLKAKK